MQSYKIPLEIVEQIVYDYLEDLVKTKKDVLASFDRGTEITMEAREVINAAEDIMDYLKEQGTNNELFKFAEEL